MGRKVWEGRPRVEAAHSSLTVPESTIPQEAELGGGMKDWGSEPRALG